MTQPERAIDLDLWQVRGLAVLFVLAGCTAFWVVWSLVAWEISLRERENLTRIGEAYCMSHALDTSYRAPTIWLADSRSDDPLWIALDASLVRACGGVERDDLVGEPFTLVDGTPIAPEMKPAP